MATQWSPERLMQPRLGMTLAFIAAAEPELADIPATVSYVWPRFRSGDYLVTLEYPEPVKVGQQVIDQIDAFMSELYVLTPEPSPGAGVRPVLASLARHLTARAHSMRRAVIRAIARVGHHRPALDDR